MPPIIRKPAIDQGTLSVTNMVGQEIKEKFPRVECEKGEKVSSMFATSTPDGWFGT